MSTSSIWAPRWEPPSPVRQSTRWAGAAAFYTMAGAGWAMVSHAHRIAYPLHDRCPLPPGFRSTDFLPSDGSCAGGVEALRLANAFATTTHRRRSPSLHWPSAGAGELASTLLVAAMSGLVLPESSDSVGIGSQRSARIRRVLMARGDDGRSWLQTRRGWRQFSPRRFPASRFCHGWSGPQARICGPRGFVDMTILGHGLTYYPAGTTRRFRFCMPVTFAPRHSRDTRRQAQTPYVPLPPCSPPPRRL